MDTQETESADRSGYALRLNENIKDKRDVREILGEIKSCSHLFEGISDELIDQMVPLSRIEVFQPGDTIIQEGGTNEKIYFLIDGTLGIMKIGDHVIKLKRRGDIFGEMSLISERSCSATVKAETKATVFSIMVNRIGELTAIDEKLISNSLYKLYAAILTDKLAMTTLKAIGLEQKVSERTEELEQKNRDLVEAKRAAEDASRVKTEFLSNMSHELRTPLHHILSFTQFAIKKLNTATIEQLYNYLNSALQSGKLMLSFVEDLVSLSELDLGRMRFHRRLIDIGSLVDSAVEGFSLKLEFKNLRVDIRKDWALPPIYCDRDKIMVVLQHLLANAIKYSLPGKTIWVNVSPAKIGPDTTQIQGVKFTVRDEGMGLPAAELERVFQKFSQSSMTKDGSGGKGLGLAISRGIVEAHYGLIWAENHPDGGAVFNVILPVQHEKERS